MASLGRKPGAAALTSADIPDNSITAAKIVEGTITVGDIGTNAVGADELANDAVDTNAIADDAVTEDKLANTLLAEIDANTAKVTNATHTGDVTGATALTIADNAVGSDELANNVVIDTSGAITTTGAFTSVGIDDNAVGAVAITIDADEKVGIGITTGHKQALDVLGHIHLGHYVQIILRNLLV